MNPVSQLTSSEFDRQKNSLNLIASENYPSKKTLDLLGSIWSNKYGEGYPGKRYYAGNEFTDKLEIETSELALKLFDKTGEYGVNLQVLSGSPANSLVYMTFLDPGAKILSLSLSQGGHLSHMHSTSVFNKFFEHVNYNLKQVGENNYEIDLQDFENQLNEHRPALTVIGFSAYPKSFDFAEMIKIARKYDSLVLADISHISGLVVTQNHSTPFLAGESGADFVTTTTHKTLRGPRGAMVFAKEKYMDNINKAVFPGSQGGPHFNKIAALYQSLLEVDGRGGYGDCISFDKYIKKVLENTKTLENALQEGGLEIVSPTETHLSLIKLPDEIDSLELQKKLEEFGIITNRNPLPFDKKSAWRPSGLRVGGAGLTSRGLSKDGFRKLGQIMVSIITNEYDETAVKKEVAELIDSLDWLY